MQNKPTSRIITLQPAGGTNPSRAPWTNLDGQSVVFNLSVGEEINQFKSYLSYTVDFVIYFPNSKTREDNVNYFIDKDCWMYRHHDTTDNTETAICLAPLNSLCIL